MNNPNKVNELELTVRSIEDMLPDLSTERLEKWYAIFHTALAKVKKEMEATCLNTCQICFFQEYGYRNEIPSLWYQKGSAIICFQHEYADAERLLKEAGRETDAFLPPDIATPSVESLKVRMDNLPPPPPEEDKTLEELMALI